LFNNIARTALALPFGDFRRLYLGLREYISILVLKERYMDSLEYELVGYVRDDFLASHENAFGKVRAVGAKDGMPT